MIKSLLRWVGWLLLLLFSLLLLLQAWFLLHILYWNQYNPSSSAFMQIRWEIARQNQPHVKFHYQWVDYEKISPHLKRAIIAAEDSQFLNHAGFDFKAMQNALEKNWQEGRWAVGGSTISQQLAKNLFLSDQKTPWRKLQEAVITYMLEKVMARRRILEIYLNTDHNSLNFEMVIQDEDYEGRRMWMINSLSPKALFRMKDTLEALGQDVEDVEFEWDDDVEVTTSGGPLLIQPDLDGLPCRVVVTTEVYEGKERNRVNEIRPASGSGSSTKKAGKAKGKAKDTKKAAKKPARRAVR